MNVCIINIWGYTEILPITVIYEYIYRKQQHEKRKKKKEGKNKEWSTTRTRHLRLDATTPNHYTTEADYATLGKSL